jgi:DedD protein
MVLSVDKSHQVPMSFFKFPDWLRSKTSTEQRNEPVPSLETLKQRARNRLIGATVLVILGLLTFPFLFKNPRPPSLSEVSITIPDRPDVKVVVGEIAGAPAANATDVTQVPQQAPAELPPAKNEGVQIGAEVTAPKPLPIAPAEKSKSDALGQAPVKATTEKGQASKQRFVVQVGAFAEDKKVKEVRSKLEKAGIKTYTQVIGKGQDKRTRVRVGPFEKREEAMKVQERIERLNLAVTTLAI